MYAIRYDNIFKNIKTRFSNKVKRIIFNRIATKIEVTPGIRNNLNSLPKLFSKTSLFFSVMSQKILTDRQYNKHRAHFSKSQNLNLNKMD